MRVTVGTLLGLMARGRTHAEILAASPYLEPGDLQAALEYAAWRAQALDVPLANAE